MSVWRGVMAVVWAAAVGDLSAAAAGPAVEKVRITATRKTADQGATGVRRTADAQGRGTEEHVYYRFELMRVLPTVPTNLVAEWLVAVEGPGGHFAGGHATAVRRPF